MQAESAVALVAGGTGPQQLRSTLALLPLKADLVWCAVRDAAEEAAAVGLAHVVRLDPWPGPAGALSFLSRHTMSSRQDAAVLLLTAGVRLRRGFLRRAQLKARRGAGVVIGTTSRRAGLSVRMRLRCFKRASLSPGAGVLTRSDTLLMLEGMGWLRGQRVRISDAWSLGGRIRVLSGGVARIPCHDMTPRLSMTVLIPAYNESEWIARSIRSIQAQTRPPEEIIVIDDGSTDGTGDVARSLDVTVVRTPTPSGRKGAALNAALPLVSTDAIVIVDADTIFHAEALELMERGLAGKDAVTGSVFPLNPRGLWARGRSIEYAVAAAVHKKLQLSFNAMIVLSGCISAHRTELVRAIGGFPDRTVAEDMDATWMLQLRGARLGYVSRAVAYTAEPTSWALYKGQMRRWGAAFFQSVSVHRWRLRSRPGLAFLVIASLWDIASAPLALVVAPALIAFGARDATNTLWLFPLAFIGFSGSVATYYLGIRRTLLSIPGFVLISLANSYFFFEALIREWVLRLEPSAWVKGH